MRGSRCVLVGVPVQAGAGRRGCDMGPSAYRAAGIAEAVSDLGFAVVDAGNLAAPPWPAQVHPNPAIRQLPEVAGWTATLAEAAEQLAAESLPLFLGGDHSLSAGTIAGMSRRARTEGRPLFVLWLDSHPDFHTLDTTRSGNLHGVPMAYVTGRPGFAGYFPPLEAPLDPRRVCMIGLRSVDPDERTALREAGVTVHDMRTIDEEGIARPLASFLDQVAAAEGLLHVSLDVDFLDPGIAPGVGTTVPGGTTFREAHLVMEMLHDSGLVRALDLVELNPFLDERGRTALLMVDLAASLLGRRVLDRPTRSY
ncbi:arginase [Methylobacterium sp. 4-46]|uniref:arginase n=1 Tax=unclassified Methylobacterium TaxID=2615210 RepID=UPI000152D19F|nr:MULTISPECIES: arginase [Methylobacterium]ACA16309.1 arginase [Methylobacterium sp. 4-46]WFT82017.1 arginase [Methylobacterium nodulans]